jgi:nucleoid-associated protein YgaU
MRYLCAAALIGVCVVGAVGCKSQQSKPETVVEDKGLVTEPVVSIKPGPGGTGTGAGMTDYGTGSGTGRSADVVIPPGPTPRTGQSYTVQKGDTLYSLARRFYSDQAKWKVILEANRAAIPNPDVIRVGQVLTIPPAN